MERLPYIDDHLMRIAASPERVWTELLTTLRKQFDHQLPEWLIRAWGLKQSTRRGDWQAEVKAGDTIAGFGVAAAHPPWELTLRGEHRFSIYELRFDLKPASSAAVELHAKTLATFPGPQGRLYRALVISTGGHQIIIRRMLGATARRAERRGADSGERGVTEGGSYGGIWL